MRRSRAAEASKELAAALRAGDDEVARSLARRSGIPEGLLSRWELGPCGIVGLDDAALALSCVASIAEGVPFPGAWLSDPDVISLVADAVELAAADGAGRPWQLGVMAIDPEGCPGARELLQARAAEGSGRGDQARLLIGACLKVAPDLGPAVRDAMEFELCAGNWARAFELASSLGDDDVAGPLLRPLEPLREPARGAERAGRNQPCPCGSGRKYKACCRAKDLEGGTHPLTLRAPAMYAMLATYAQRARGRQLADRLSACAIGAPHAAMLALDVTVRAAVTVSV
jgi:SEC-C motif-containing protein